MKKKLLYGLLLLLPVAAIAQTYEQYYDNRWKKTEPATATYYSVVTKEDTLWHRRDYYISQKRMQMNAWFLDSACKKQQGKATYYFSNGKVSSFGNYVNGKKAGLWAEFYSNGALKDSAVYAAGQPVGEKLSWHINGYLSDSLQYDGAGNATAISWFDNGNPSSAGRYVSWKKQNGKWKYFHRNGQVSSIETYDSGKLVQKEYFTERGEPADTASKDSKAEFRTGLGGWRDYLSRRLSAQVSNNRLIRSEDATVTVIAWVAEDGKITDAYTSSPPNRDFDEMALQTMLQSPAWKPAISHNRRVGMWITQPITFR